MIVIVKEVNQMNKRVKLLRDTLNLSQEEFGNRIGITRSSVSNIEKGTRNMSDQTIKSICREFKVDYFWLTEGTGEMFTDLPETLVDELADEYDLSETDKLIVLRYLQLPKEKRDVVVDYLKSIFIVEDK